jgi:hypothetical protein
MLKIIKKLKPFKRIYSNEKLDNIKVKPQQISKHKIIIDQDDIKDGKFLIEIEITDFKRKSDWYYFYDNFPLFVWGIGSIIIFGIFITGMGFMVYDIAHDVIKKN